MPSTRSPMIAGENSSVSDAATAFLGAIVVDEAAAPFAPQRRVIAARDQSGILQRDHRLVIVAIERPGLDLALVALSAVQQTVEGMKPMIAARADLAQPCLELIGREQRHSVISRPSSATSQPAASIRRRSAEPSTRMGFVLLMCK